MNLPDGLLPAAWSWLGHALFVLVLAVGAWRAPWWRLRETGMLNVFLGVCVALMVLWSIKAGVRPGLNFHVLGATLLTLMFGGLLAVAGISVVLVAVTAYGMSGWQTFSLNALLMGALPALVSWGVYRLTQRFLPRHLFIYIFVCGFFGAAVAMAATGIASAALFVLSGTYGFDQLMNDYLPYFLLMVFPEAILTGSFVALLVVYRPHWIWTYDEDLYLRR
jgi:uncharacterized membrane protein